ncbi:MAG: AMP-binding protein [Pyrinomonadaceae bacterium]|nr:AMP-binding protein [Pyrinomonadaceae bacterium]
MIERGQLTKFMRQVGASNYDELYKYSIENVEQFTAQVLKFLDIKFNPPYEKLLDTSNGIQFPKWCVGGGLNITEMCLDRWQTDEMKDQPAIICEDENGFTFTETYAGLLREVEDYASGLRLKGLGKGDAIGIHLPMSYITVIALLGVSRIGAIAVPVFSGYGEEAISSRMNAVGAKALITCDGFVRRGKEFKAFEIASQAVEKCPTIEKVFIETLLNSPESPFKHHNEIWNSFSGKLSSDNLSSARYAPPNRDNPIRNHTFAEPTNAEDPLMILYTSGTTGKPKGILHTHCGFPIKAAQDMAFGMDVGRGTRVSWLTDLGWMMGPWLIYGALLNGATICLYDGAPDYPNADRMWEFCAKHEVEVFGISPTLIRTLMTHGDDLPAKHDLSRLRVLASTGEPWNETPWRWLFEVVGESRVPIINYSGGTEISGGILSGNPLLPIKPMSFSAACLGIDVAILDENGAEVERGTVGELAIRKPWIGMARGFYQENERYLETYWSRFENVWVHGDFVIQDADGQFYILGRSDDTLKIAGKRVGPAEVETLLVNHGLVVESAVVGVPDDIKGTAMIAFCVTAKDADFQPVALEEELKRLVAEAMGKPLKPNRVLFVNALPKTRNGKVMRRVIRSAYLGEDAGDLSALENPQCVDYIRKLSDDNLSQT